jgi:hypothetical protein
VLGSKGSELLQCRCDIGEELLDNTGEQETSWLMFLLWLGAEPDRAQ